MAYLLALDQGTTSSRAILFDDRGNEVALAILRGEESMTLKVRLGKRPG